MTGVNVFTRLGSNLLIQYNNLLTQNNFSTVSVNIKRYHARVKHLSETWLKTVLNVCLINL